jgi:serine/threonine-protein kinase RsbW
VDAESCDALVLAVDEVCANVVIHGYGGVPGPLTVDVAAEGADVRVTVVDAAPAFDPTTVDGRGPPGPTVPLDDRVPGGLGWFLVRRSVDAVEYERAAGHNVVTLHRRPRAS